MIDRREFIKGQIAAGLVLGGAGTGLLLPRPLWAAAEPDLGVVQGDPGPAARAAVELLGGMKRFVKPGQRVVIKPNMSFARPVSAGTNTHPEVVRELAAMCKEAGASKVLILDNPLAPAEACLEASKIKEACQTIEEDMVHQVEKERHFQKTKLPKGQSLPETDVMKEVLRADVLIAAPAAKHHSSTGVSLSMKGLMGLVLDRRAFHWRYDLDQAIVDLAAFLRPHLVVIDASRVLSSGGPNGPGKVLGARTILASTDMVAADAATVARFEWQGQRHQPRQVRHIRLAAEQGLGRMDVENLNVKTLTL